MKNSKRHRVLNQKLYLLYDNTEAFETCRFWLNASDQQIRIIQEIFLKNEKEEERKQQLPFLQENQGAYDSHSIFINNLGEFFTKQKQACNFPLQNHFNEVKPKRTATSVHSYAPKVSWIKFQPTCCSWQKLGHLQPHYTLSITVLCTTACGDLPVSHPTKLSTLTNNNICDQLVPESYIWSH